MKAKQLKKILNRLTPEQLEKEIYINIAETPLKIIESVEVIKRTYLMCSDGVFAHSLGSEGMDPCPEEWEKGNIHIHVENQLAPSVVKQ